MIFNLFIIFFVSVILTIVTSKYAHSIQLIDVPCERKQHSGVVPLVGGVVIYLSLLIYQLLFGYGYEYSWHILGIASVLVVTSVIDDMKGVSYNFRLLIQCCVAIAMIFVAGVELVDLGNLTGSLVALGALSVPFTVFSTVGVINAMNFVDGEDGLCGGLALVSLLYMTYFAENAEASSITLLYVVTVLVFAFLLFNARWTGRRKAAIFLGDSGSVLLGFILAWFVIELSQGDDRAFRPVTALWLLAVPLVDTVASIARRLIHKKSPFSPDREHLHHILKRLGLSDNLTVLVIYLVAVLCALVGVVGEEANWPESIMFVGFLCAFFLYFVIIMNAWRITRFIRKMSQVWQG